LEIDPGAKLVTTPKCKGILMGLLMIPEEKFIMISDSETSGEDKGL